MVCCVETSAQSLVPKVLVFFLLILPSQMTQNIFPLEWLKMTGWYSLAGTFYTPGKKSGGLELCKIKLFYKVVMWLLFKNIRTLKMIPWRLFISLIFISEKISKHPIPKPKETPEDKNKNNKNKNIKFMIRLRVLTEGIYLSCFILRISLLKLFPSRFLLTRMV